MSLSNLYAALKAIDGVYTPPSFIEFAPACDPAHPVVLDSPTNVVITAYRSSLLRLRVTATSLVVPSSQSVDLVRFCASLETRLEALRNYVRAAFASQQRY